MELLCENDFYRTPDIAHAAVIALHYPIEVIDENTPHQAHFVFKRVGGFDNFVEQCWRGEILVDYRAYYNKLRELKARIHNEK